MPFESAWKKTWANYIMLMFCNALWMSGDINGLLCYPGMAKWNKLYSILNPDISMFLLAVIAFY